MNQISSLYLHVPRTMKTICTSTKRALFVFTERSTREDKFVAEYFHKERGYQVAKANMSKDDLQLVIQKMGLSEDERLKVLNELFKNNLVTS